MDAFEEGFKTMGRYFCRRCAGEGRVECADERYSMGCYAAMECDAHWAKNSLNNDNEFDPDYAGERLEADY